MSDVVIHVQTTHKWSHITDLAPHWETLSNKTLEHWAMMWEAQKQNLDADAQKKFLQEMQREWAIETGLIENLYTLDRGITQTLIEQGIDAIDIPHNATNKSPSYVKRLIKDQEFVVQALFDFVNGTRPLSTSYIKELHAQLTRSQDTTEAIDSMGNYVTPLLLKGEWKKHRNNPTRFNGQTHEYCPPEHVASEMDNLVKLHAEHMEKGVPADVEAAWLHHRFTQIHPFQDGNGRVARALATLVFLKAGCFPLVVLSDDRLKYIEALEQADAGDLQHLISFFGELAQNAFVKAISVSGNVIKAQQERKAVFSSIKSTLLQKAQQKIRPEQVFDVAEIFVNEAYSYIDNIREELVLETQGLHAEDRPEFILESSNGDTWHYFRGQIYRIGQLFDYYVNLEKYHRWIRLQIRMSNQKYNIVFSFHPVSKDFQGIMAAVAFFEVVAIDEGAQLPMESQPLSSAPFIFTAHDKLEDSRPKFLEWIEKRILQGLLEWQQKM